MLNPFKQNGAISWNELLTTGIPDVGRFFTFQDPQGAVISVITYVEK